MMPLGDSFDDARDDFPPPGPVVRPMECRDAWDMTALLQRNTRTGMTGDQFVAMKERLENMIPKILVDIQPGGKLSGFAIAATQANNFSNPRGILKIITSPDFDRAESTKRLLRGIARQLMAAGQTTMELVASDDDEVLKNACKLYGGVCVKQASPSGEFPAINSHVFVISDLTKHFGLKSQQTKPKDPSP